MPQIEVTFDIDANGILHVGAKDLGTGKEQKITITASSGLSKDEVEKMRKDAEAHADEDKAKLEEIETRNEADNAVYRTEKLLKDNADKIVRGRQGQARSRRRRREGSAKGSDTAAIKSASEKLNEVWQAVSTRFTRPPPRRRRPKKARPARSPARSRKRRAQVRRRRRTKA